MSDNQSENFLRHFRRAVEDRSIGDGVFRGLHDSNHALLAFQLLELLEAVDPEHDPMPAPWRQVGDDAAFAKYREEWRSWLERRFGEGTVRTMRRTLYKLLRVRIPRDARQEVPLPLHPQFEAICAAQFDAERLALAAKPN